jgi:DNA-binding CsgD family transcriptional regulator
MVGQVLSEGDLVDDKVPAEERKGLIEYVRYGGAAILAAWFLLIFSGEIWGLEFVAAADSVVQLSLLSIGSCFVTIIILNAVAAKGEALFRNSRLLASFAGILLCAGTTVVVFSPFLSPAFFYVASVMVGCGGAYFVCDIVRWLAKLTVAMTLVAGGSIFLIGIFIYAFVLYIPMVARLPILCALPLVAAASFYGEFREEVRPTPNSSIFLAASAPLTLAPPASAPLTPASSTAQGKFPIGWRSVAMLSVFCLFSCVIRGYLPYYMDNADFSYIRSFSIILMFFVTAAAIICGVLLSKRFKLSTLYRWAFLSGVVFFALVPILGLSNPSVLALTDAYRGLCALLSLVFFANMARQLPYFGFRFVGGGMAFYIAFGLIGWLLGALLFRLDITSDALRVISSVQCVLVLLAYILFFRQAEIAQFLDEEQDITADAHDGAQPALRKSALGNESRQGEAGQGQFDPGQPDPGQPSGRWRSHCERLAREYGLTEREAEVFLLLAKGYKASNISDSLTISYNTTRNHISRIYQKCGIHNQQEFVEFVNPSLSDTP